MTDPAAAAAEPARTPRWRRVVVKLSGEALMGASQFGIDAATLGLMARQVERVVAVHHVEVAIVVGGGNIVRGLDCRVQTAIEMHQVAEP
ncbi:MAG TPA: UMP kinase, partial [Candidatus Dormibacteraeota bacterium]